MSQLDADRFPQLAAYLDQLPDGLASYPDCKAKGSLILTALEEHDVSGIRDGLPEELLAMIHQPPPAGVWVPAPFSDAVFYVFVDLLYPTLEQTLQWTYERTIRGTRSKLYRALTSVASPWALLRIGTAAHGLFQKGTDLHVVKTETGARLRLSHPPFLHCGFNHASNIAALRAVLETTGAKEADVEMLSSVPTEALYRARWS